MTTFEKSCSNCKFRNEFGQCESTKACGYKRESWQPNDETADTLCSHCKHKSGYFCNIAPGQKSDFSCFEVKVDEPKVDDKSMTSDKLCEFFKPDPQKYATCVNFFAWHHNGSYRCPTEGETETCRYHIKMNNRCYYEDADGTCHNRTSIRRSMLCERMKCASYYNSKYDTSMQPNQYCMACKHSNDGCFMIGNVKCNDFEIKDDITMSNNQINCKFCDTLGDCEPKPICRCSAVMAHYRKDVVNQSFGQYVSSCPFYDTEDAKLKCKFFESSERYKITCKTFIKLILSIPVNMQPTKHFGRSSKISK